MPGMARTPVAVGKPGLSAVVRVLGAAMTSDPNPRLVTGAASASARLAARDSATVSSETVTVTADSRAP
eukprot:scaffold5668_cov111-Isochrysis_galbana.AAC.23